MSETKDVLFTVMASVDGNPVGGRFEFMACDETDITENEVGLYEYAEQVFDEVEGIS